MFDVHIDRAAGRVTLSRGATVLLAAFAATLLAVMAIVVVTLSAAQASAYTAQDVGVEYTAAEHLADLRTREATAGDLIAGTCEEVAAAVTIPTGWAVECVDHIDTAGETVVGMASLNYKLITLERITDPQRMRYAAVHEAGHAWAFSILDQAAMDALVAQVGGTAWDGGGATYRSNVTESFANAFASCRGYGSMDYLPMGCDVADAALTAAGTR